MKSHRRKSSEKRWTGKSENRTGSAFWKRRGSGGFRGIREQERPYHCSRPGIYGNEKKIRGRKQEKQNCRRQRFPRPLAGEINAASLYRRISEPGHRARDQRETVREKLSQDVSYRVHDKSDEGVWNYRMRVSDEAGGRKRALQRLDRGHSAR